MYLSCCAKLPLRVALPPGIPSSSAVNSPPTGGAVELSLGPRPHRLLKLRAGESSVEWRAAKTPDNRESGSERTAGVPFRQGKDAGEGRRGEECRPYPRVVRREGAR